MECIPKSLRLNFLSGVELPQFMLRIASEQYGHEANPEQKSFWNDIYPQIDIYLSILSEKW